MALWLSLGLVAIAGVGVAAPLREPWVALIALPAVFVAPGLGWARAFGRRAGVGDGLRVGFDAFWLSLPTAILGWALARNFGGGAWTLLAVSAGGALVGGLWERRVQGPAVPWVPVGRERFGAVAAVAMIAVWFAQSAADIARPLDRYWYAEQREDGPADASQFEVDNAGLQPAEGWVERTEVAEGVTFLRPAGAHASLVGVGTATQGILLRGPVGARLDGVPGGPMRVEASPIEVSEEGPVWRYLDRGVAARWLLPASSEGAALTLTFSEPAESSVVLLARPSAMWALQDSGELHWAHYYQLLNMVEQLRWVDERWVTDVQPPLWTWVLGPAVLVTGGGLPTANVLLAFVLVLSSLAGLLFLRAHAPTAPSPAWLLPGLAAVVSGRLLLEPGSAGMPDAIYAVALVAALSGRPVAFGIAAQLLRYPGFAVVLVGTAIARAWRDAFRLCVGVAACALLFGLGGFATGALDGWLATVGWEAGPEHWHGEFDPVVLLGRAPKFYWMWLLYSGGTLLLAALAWPLGTRVSLGTALVYSLLLCTIDHAPTHYFVPLVQLAALGSACTAASLRAAPLRQAVASAAVLGLCMAWMYGEILA